MSIVSKKMSDVELKFYASKVFPIIKVFGVFGWWVIPKDGTDDIHHSRPVAPAFHIKKHSKEEIVIPSPGYNGKLNVSPSVVLPQLKRSELAKISGYSVKVKKLEKASDKHEAMQYKAVVTTYTCNAKPKALLVRKVDLGARPSQSQDRIK